jgi:hypothetical protein
MIYLQCTRIAINRPEGENEDFDWYWLSDGIHSSQEGKYSKKKYVWSDEELKSFECKATKDKVLQYIRDGKAKYFKIKKKLFSGREYLVYENECRNTWYLDEIERIDAWFKYGELNMAIDEVRERLDVEEYAKMMKGLGLNDLK